MMTTLCQEYSIRISFSEKSTLTQQGAENFCPLLVLVYLLPYFNL